MSILQPASASDPLSADAGLAPAIDEATLGQLRELDPSGANQIVRRVLETYQRSLTKAMSEFAAARETGDLSVLGRIAHTLRSSSASVGALHFSGRCKEVEILIRDGHTAQLQAPLDALQNESVRVQAAIAAMLTVKGSAP